MLPFYYVLVAVIFIAAVVLGILGLFMKKKEPQTDQERINQYIQTSVINEHRLQRRQGIGMY